LACYLLNLVCICFPGIQEPGMFDKNFKNMIMIKKISFYVMAIGFLLICNSSQLIASTHVKTIATSNTSVVSKSNESADIKAIEQRVSEIKAMDISKLNPSERNNLQKELLSINHRLHIKYYHHGPGIYISVPALIIIILILILIVR